MAGRSGAKVRQGGVIRRTLGAGPTAAGLLLEALRCHDGHLRAFWGTGSPPARFAPDGAPGCALPMDLREVSGGTLGVFAEGPAVVALSDGARDTLAPVAADVDLLAGRDCLLAFRLEETAEQLGEWLAYHANHHGAGGAVIVHRVPPDDPAGFADALSPLLPEGFTAILLDSPVPLGKPGQPPESHPILAPDAPGKDRMEVPEPDPWRSPLGEGLMFEVVKWRFLAHARAVLTLDPCDWLVPRDSGAPSAFDLCRTARHGVVPLAGRRVYPWRVRAGAPARMGDHICAPFDRGEGLARWGVAPDLAGLENTWRMVRVAYAKPDAKHAARFWRAMAIRVPGRAASELAPKTSLVEDAELLRFSRDVLGWKPVRPPVSRPRADSGTGRTAIVTTMKNEGPFILEWLAWHRAIGVDDFLIYTNDCTDGTDTMLDLLQRKGIVQHRDNPFRAMDLKPQHAALQAAEDEPLMRDCGWGICMDVDEFINIKLGDGRLPTLYAAMEAALPGANMIALTWRLFGNAEVRAYRDEFIVDQFDRCAPEVIRKPHQAWGFKTLFRNIDIYKKLGVHRPKGLVPDLWDRVKWLNGSGRPMPRAMFRNGWRSTLETYGYDWVQLNHYAVRSAESFLVKRDRGRVNHVDRDQGLNYWFRMNHNVEQDGSLRARLPMLQAEWDRLLADPEIRAAHDFSVAAHRAKITELRATENYERFYGELTGERMETLCRMQRHFGSAVFNAGPQVIPEDLHLRDLPADFFFTVEPQGEAAH
ncbi:MAG: glycosyltransferase family 2 protein [Paracoccaceae bacterium]|nr:MAG: glycosyltransferase family 2 protein [Paracoccaceae bacterium]